MSVAALKAAARKLIYKNIQSLLIISILYVAMVTLLSELAYRMPGTVDIPGMYERLAAGEMPGIAVLYNNYRPTGMYAAVFISLILRPVIDFGLKSCCLKISRNESITINEILNGFKNLFRVFIIFFITTLLILLWSILLIVPGIIAAYSYRMAYYIALDDPKKSPLQCIDESVLMMRGSKTDLLTIDISFLGWYLANFVIILLLPLPFALQVILLWLAPYRGLTNAGFYEYRKSILAV